MIGLKKMGRVLLHLSIFVMIAGLLHPAAGKRSSSRIKKFKKEAITVVDSMAGQLNQAARTIWEYAELALKEHKSSAYLASMLTREGFTVQMGSGGLSVAFVAAYGQGKPVIGFLGEFDALPGLSQKSGVPAKEVVQAGKPGHGCGHNIFGVASAGAAIAVKRIMVKYKLRGTVKFFGCPAEETVEGKVYMARDGAFDGLDICFDWHPSSKNRVSLKTSNALNNFEVIYRGRTAHSAGDPWNGRSALDGIELLNHGLNYLREHVKPTVRIHYVIPSAGLAPNVVPDYARGWYYVRGKDRQEVEDVFNRVKNIVKGAALMSGTSSHIHIRTGVYNYLKNREVARLLYKNLKWVGPPDFTPDEQAFARKMQSQLNKKTDGFSTNIEPLEEPVGYWGGGSTDAADVSWLVPTASVNVACWPLNVPGHSWCVVSSVGASPGFRGMRVAAKVLAASGIEALLDRSIIEKAGSEFKKATAGFVYKSAIPVGQKPLIRDGQEE
jgi:aminobenzoyl-glutamate utilization protein B